MTWPQSIRAREEMNTLNLTAKQEWQATKQIGSEDNKSSRREDSKLPLSPIAVIFFISSVAKLLHV